MVLGILNSNRDQTKWVPPKSKRVVGLNTYPSAVMLGRMKPIGGAPVDAFCCPSCYSIFVDGENCKPSNK